MKPIPMDITTIKRDFDLTQGFAWIELEINGEEMTLQLCLEERQRKDKGAKEGHIKQFLNCKGQSGFDWGLCAEANSNAVKELGEGPCWDLLKKELRKVGVLPTKEK